MSAPTGVLAEIVRRRREDVAVARRLVPLEALRERALALPRGTDHRDLEAALRAHVPGRPRVIAELKRAAPSAGVLRPAFDPAALARGYEGAGAAALSVLTETHHFWGQPSHLVEARASVSIPVLRKDFIVEPWQVWETRLLGADAMLLIVAALERARLEELAGLAAEAGLATLVEVHSEPELDVALGLGARLIGVNNRDLRTLTIDLTLAPRLRARIGGSALVVGESGYERRAELDAASAAGVHAFLVGTAFMKRPDPGAELRALLEVS